MMLPATRPHESERGYSLLELMVVVAMIGMLSLVTVPAMTNFSRMNRVRSATREFNSDLRAIRALAITRSEPLTITIHNGDTPSNEDLRGRYELPDVIPAAKRTKRLDDIVYFVGQNDTTTTITFLPNGTVQNLTGTTTRTIELKSEYELPNDDVTITFQPSGSVRTKSE